MTDQDVPTAEETQVDEPALIHGAPSSLSRGQLVVHVDRDGYLELVTALRDDGYAFCSDLTAIDYLLATDRPLPTGVTPERFEVVVSLLHMEEAKRVRVRAQVPEREPTLPTLFELFPGTEAMEREVYDLFGIVFDGHPDLTRILMPDEWEGHPLRKDYPIGRIPVQFKDAPGPR
ncbi:MAG: NADH-quinone oxidoreductase subunit C [Acidimicrobiia bacterium]|nr:NADH-quinone oxidoreductase subunit C [Acidimicrobiia bacterium]